MSEAQDVLAAQQAAADAVIKQSKMLDKIFSEKQMLERSHSSICGTLDDIRKELGVAHNFPRESLPGMIAVVRDCCTSAETDRYNLRQDLEREQKKNEDLASRLNRVGQAHTAAAVQLAAANARIAHLEALLDEQRRGTPIIVDPADPAISLALNAHKRIDNLEQKLEDKK